MRVPFPLLAAAVFAVIAVAAVVGFVTGISQWLMAKG